MSSKKDEQINLYISAITTRDPSKRQIKPVDKDAFQLFDDFESGSDEDFVIDSDDESDDDVKEESDDNDDDNDNKEDDNSKSEEDDNNDDVVAESETQSNVIDAVFHKNNDNEKCGDEDVCETTIARKNKLETVMICMMCLLDVSYSDNELIECDGCGVVVHEDCYKICDNVFMSCDNSDASTDPWFCDACLNNVKDPRCELCPVEGGGVFKRTENNRWVHLLCALYTPGVAFNDVDSLSEITLSELPLKEWSGKECSICSNPFFAKTGVCISCDAGLCKNVFHVLCAQKEGLLSEPNIEENPDDPYFAQCQQHTDKEVAKRRRKSWVAAINRQKLRIEDWNKNGHFTDVRLLRKLEFFSTLYYKYRELAPTPFVPLTKVPCYLETSPVAVYLFKKKATNLRLPQDIINSCKTSDSKTGTGGVPVFSPDFITYFLDREKKIDELSVEIVRLETSHRDMQISEQNTSHQFNKIMAKKDTSLLEFKLKYDKLSTLTYILNNLSPLPELSEQVERLLSKFSIISSTNTLSHNNDTFDNETNMSVNTTTTTTNNNNNNNNNNNSNTITKIDSVINECCICKSVSDQHLMIDCDDCSKLFHLNCLEPPLLRMPRKTKLYGWQCSNCVHDSSSELVKQNVDINRPRQLRKGTDMCNRYKRFENLTVSVNAKNRLLQNSKKIANKNRKKQHQALKKQLVAKAEEKKEEEEEKEKKEEKELIKEEESSSIAEQVSETNQRRSHRSKKKPVDLQYEYETDDNQQCSNCADDSNEEVVDHTIDINRPRQLRKGTDICSRKKRFENHLTVSMTAKNRLLQNSKKIANKRNLINAFKKPVVFLTKSDEIVVKNEEDDNVTNQRRSRRSKKRPVTLLDDFETQGFPKRAKHSKEIMRARSIKKSRRSLPHTKKISTKSVSELKCDDRVYRTAHSLPPAPPPLSLFGEEGEQKSMKQLITFFPSPQKNCPSKLTPMENDQVPIGVMAKKPMLGTRDSIGIGKVKLAEKRPIMIKWHGDQDDVRTEMSENHGSGILSEISRF